MSCIPKYKFCIIKDVVITTYSLGGTIVTTPREVGRDTVVFMPTNYEGSLIWPNLLVDDSDNYSIWLRFFPNRKCIYQV